MSDHEVSEEGFSSAEPAEGDMRAVIDTAQQAVDPSVVEAGYLAVANVGPGARICVIDLESKSPNPRRKRATVTLHTAVALAAYVNNHHEGDATALYGDADTTTVVAVLNGHASRQPSSDEQREAQLGTAGWGDHRATLQLRKTPEWRAWTDADGQAFDQVAFAEFIEDHQADIVDPPAADMLELAKTFEAKSDANFKSAIRLDSGQRRLTFEETIAARAGVEGNIEVPELVTLGLRPFDGTEPYRIQARFRFRVASGSVKFVVVLDRPDLVLRSAFDDVLAMLADRTGFAPLRGVAPA